MASRKLEILAYEPTDLGTLCLRRRELLSEPGTFVTEITLDQEFLMSSQHTASERSLATAAVELHGGKGLTALIGGLGLGYTAHAALASERVAYVEVVEYLPQVIGWLRRGLLPLSPELAADPRLTVTEGDVYARLSSAPRRPYDLILIDVDHSPGERLAEASAPFYGERDLRLARAHLAPGGILGVWSYAESPPFAAALRTVFREVQTVAVRYANCHVGEDCTDWLYFARR